MDAKSAELQELNSQLVTARNLAQELTRTREEEARKSAAAVNDANARAVWTCMHNKQI